MNGLFGKKQRKYEEIIDAYGTDIKQVAYSYVKDKQMAEDITQETFLTCLTKAKTFKGKSSLKTWLFTIAINRCKDYLKNAYTKRVTIDNHLIDMVDQHSPSAESVAISHYESQHITAYILQLPVQYREMIVLYYFKEFSVKEIATTLAMSENTVKTCLRRSRELLKEGMTNDE